MDRFSPTASARALSSASTACACIFSKPASPTAPACCCCTVFPSSPIPGARSWGRWPLPGITSSLPICAGRVVPPGGAPITTTICARSADWKDNKPHKLTGWTATELANMPTYYVMDLAEDMPTAVAKEMPSPAEIAACHWLPDEELAVYAGEYRRNGFQGGLNWYRSRTSGMFEAELQLFSGKTIDVPSIFISGSSDWASTSAQAQ